MYLVAMLLSLLIFPLILLCVWKYVLRASKQNLIMKDRNISYAWAAWIPCFGSIPFTYSYLDRLEEKHKVNSLKPLFIMSFCLIYFSALFIFVPFISLLLIAFGIIYCLIETLAIHEAFETYASKENGIIYTLLYVLCPITMLYTFTKLQVKEKVQSECETCKENVEDKEEENTEINKEDALDDETSETEVEHVEAEIVEDKPKKVSKTKKNKE